MSDSVGEVQTNQIDLIDILAEIRLINVAEVKIVQEVVSLIDAHYQEHKSMISTAKVAALILNRDDVPNLYATSVRGYNNQLLEFQNHFGLNSFKLKTKIVPWALDKAIREGLPKSLHQDLAKAIDTSRSSTPPEDRYVLEVLTTIDLANVAEFQIVREAVKYIQENCPQAMKRINLSDVCALVLNHPGIASVYATSAEEYEEFKQKYISHNQSQVNEVIAKIVDKIQKEGSESIFNHDSLVAASFQRRKKITKSWNT